MKVHFHSSGDNCLCQEQGFLLQYPSYSSLLVSKNFKLFVCQEPALIPIVISRELTMRFTEGGLNVNLKTFSSFEQFIKTVCSR